MITVIIAIMITLKTFVMIIAIKVMVTVMLYLFKLLLFCNFFFLLKLYATEKPILQTMNYKQKSKKKQFLPPTLPVPLITENQLLLPTVLPRPTPKRPSPTHSETDTGKVSNSFVLQNIFNLVPFSLVHNIFSFIVY